MEQPSSLQDESSHGTSVGVSPVDIARFGGNAMQPMETIPEESYDTQGPDAVGTGDSTLPSDSGGSAPSLDIDDTTEQRRYPVRQRQQPDRLMYYSMALLCALLKYHKK